MMNMKKWTALLLIAVFCLSLCGCGALESLRPVPTPAPTETPAPTPELTPEPTPEPTPAPTPEPTPAPSPEPKEERVTVSINRTELSAMDPQSGQTRILSFTYDTPIVEMESNPEAAKKINEFIALQSEAFYTGENYGDGFGTGYNNMLTLAEDNYVYQVESGAENPGIEMSADRRAAVVRNDGTVLSFLINDYYYMGGAHGSTICRAYCFDVSSGELLTLKTVSSDPAAFAVALANVMIMQVNESEELQQRIDLLSSDLASALSALVREGSWYFDYDAIVIFSDDYEISSHASGPVAFRIPYDAVAEHLVPRYLSVAPEGDVQFYITPTDAVGEADIEIIDMVRVGDGEQTLYLIANGKAHDVRLTSVEYSGAFYETAQLWSCSVMEKCAVQVSTWIPDGMPNLKLSYRTADGLQNLYLTQSGEDGSLILMDDSIEAIG